MCGGVAVGASVWVCVECVRIGAGLVECVEASVCLVGGVVGGVFSVLCVVLVSSVCTTMSWGGLESGVGVV